MAKAEAQSIKMKIDFHTHCFPDRIAAAAVERVAGAAEIEIEGDGTADSLIESMDRCGVDISVILNIATNTKQQTNVNNFAIELDGRAGRLISLGSVHPKSDNIKEEILRIKNAGLKGIKIHPDYMHTPIDDPKMIKIMNEATENGLFVITHAGFDVISPDFVHAPPHKIAKALKEAKGVCLIASHLGGNCMWEDVERHLAGQDVYFDLSLIAAYSLTPALARRIIDNHDPEKLLFGSDSPWFAADKTIEYIENLGLSEKTKEKIYCTNAKKLLDI